MQKGGNKRGFLKSASKLTSDAMKALKEAFASLYNNRNEERVVVLNNGVDFKESSSTCVELQLNENKKSNYEHICSALNVPPAMVLGGATDADEKTFYKYTIPPIICAIESALNKDFLLIYEQGSFYFAIDTTELVRGDMRDRYEAYAIGLKNSFLQPDDIRTKENLNPLNLDFVKLSLSDVLYDPKTGAIYTPNTDKAANVGQSSTTINKNVAPKGGGKNESGTED